MHRIPQSVSSNKRRKTNVPPPRPPPQTNEPAALREILIRDGVVVFKVMEEAQALQFAERLKGEMASSHYYKQSPEVRAAVMKWFNPVAFGAVGQPDFMHLEVVRRLRAIYFNAVKEKFGGIGGTDQVRVQFDRVGIREPGDKPSSESWHFDKESTLPSLTSADVATAVPSIEFYCGGWLSLKGKNRFTFAPESHKQCDAIVAQLKQHMDAKALAKWETTGFCALDAEYSKQMKARQITVDIPPGYGILIGDVAHCINGALIEEEMMRLFCGVVFSKGSMPQDQVEKVNYAIQHQSAAQLPPAMRQECVLLDPNFVQYHRKEAGEFCTRFHPQILQPRTKLAVEKGYLPITANRLEGPDAYNLQRQREYTDEEKRILFPVKIE